MHRRILFDMILSHYAIIVQKRVRSIYEKTFYYLVVAVGGIL